MIQNLKAEHRWGQSIIHDIVIEERYTVAISRREAETSPGVV